MKFTLKDFASRFLTREQAEEFINKFKSKENFQTHEEFVNQTIALFGEIKNGIPERGERGLIKVLLSEGQEVERIVQGFKESYLSYYDLAAMLDYEQRFKFMDQVEVAEHVLKSARNSPPWIWGTAVDMAEERFETSTGFPVGEILDQLESIQQENEDIRNIYDAICYDSKGQDEAAIEAAYDKYIKPLMEAQEAEKAAVLPPEIQRALDIYDKTLSDAREMIDRVERNAIPEYRRSIAQAFLLMVDK